MNGETINARVLEILTRVVPESKDEEIDSEVPFRDQFDIDSLDFLNFVLSVEEAFGVKVPEADYPRLSTFQGAVSYLSTLLATRVE